MKLFNVGLMVDPVENGFQKAMKKVCTEYRELNCGGPVGDFNRNVLQIAYEFKPDLIFIQIQAPNIIYPETAAQLGGIGFVMNFSGDIRRELPPWYIDIGQRIQLSTFTNMMDVKRCRQMGVKSDYLEIGVDPERFKRHDNPIPAPSIVFMGNNYGSGYFPLSDFRIEATERLKKEFGDQFGVYGTGWANNAGNANGNQVDESRIYNGAKIAINISHFETERYSSDRLLRALASGVMVLTHNYPDIDLMYKPGQHLIPFNTLDELVTQCRHYLIADEEREKIAAAGMQHVLENYTFDHMAQNIVKLYNQHKNGK